LFGFAGLWESWRDPHGQPLETCTILTTAANELLSALHRRMPVILHPARYAAWLDPEECDPARILAGVDDEIARELTFEPVSLRVNDVGNDDARCLERIESQPGLFG
jgi:putative SOS response-associated peptidase YedK